MTLVFVRHAHRNITDRSLDNGLSDKGRDQVEDLIDDMENEVLPQARLFWSSPKLRCVETLEPLCHWADGEFVIEPLLNEQQPHESQKLFLERLQNLIDKALNQKQTIYLCSHGDVIPEIVNMLVGLQLDLGKGEAIIVERDSQGKWEVR